MDQSKFKISQNEANDSTTIDEENQPIEPIENPNSQVEVQDVDQVQLSQQNIIEQISQIYRNQFSKQTFNHLFAYQFPLEKNSDSNKVTTCRFEPADQYIAAGCEDGTIKILSPEKEILFYQLTDPLEKPSPVTCLRWRPSNPQDNIRHTLLATYANGNILFWHCPSRQTLIRAIEEKNPINCCDFTFDGLKYATGGYDCQIRLYDATRAHPLSTYFGASSTMPTHTNRIFAIKFHSTDPFIMYTAGWDNLVILWDLRTKQSQQYIYGPIVCGDALDQKKNMLLTGSWRDNSQIEIWDDRTLKKVQQIEQSVYLIKYELGDTKARCLLLILLFKAEKCYLQLQFRQTNYLDLCRKCGDVSMKSFLLQRLFSEVRVYEEKNSSFYLKDVYSQIKRGVMSVDSSSKQKKMCYGVADGTLGVMEIV